VTLMKFLTADNLSRKQGMVHAFFTREGGVSEGIYASLNCGPGSGDTREAVIENRGIALSTLAQGCDAKLVTLYQIHSAEAVCVHEPWGMDAPPKADAMTTRTRGLALGILTADCAPVLLADTEAGVIGAAHAGWRGAFSGVIESVVSAMEILGARRTHIAAAIGPCISRTNYEVGDDFRAQFLEAESASARFFSTGERPQHWQFDLEACVADRLKRAAVDNINVLGACTYARESEFFSFRRNTHRGERDYGRQLSAIMLGD
jgi:YfiH family protein